MDIYEEKMLEFYLNSENYLMAEEITSTFQKYKEEVRKRVIREFWTELEKSLRLKLTGTDWIIDYKGPLEIRYSYLQISLPSWKDRFAVRWEIEKERVYFGLYGGRAKDRDFDYEPIYQKRQKDGRLGEMKDTDMWIAWEHTDIDYANPESLKNLFRGNREVKIGEMLESLTDFCSQIKEFLKPFNLG